MDTQPSAIQPIEIAVAKLEVKHDSLVKEIGEIKTNHLAHIASDIKELQMGQIKTNLKIAYWSGGIGFLLAALQIALKFWPK